MNIHDENWEADIVFLSRPNILITGLKVFTQALIHSNLFDSKIDHNGGLKDLTLSEMAITKYKKPFVCAIIEGTNIHVFSMYFPCNSHVFLLYLLKIHVFVMYLACIKHYNII